MCLSRQAVSSDRAGEHHDAFLLYTEGLEIITGLLDQIEADGAASIADINPADHLAAVQIRLAAAPFYDRAGVIAATPAYQLEKQVAHSRMHRPLFYEHEAEIQQAASALGRYPMVAGQPYSRANWLVLAEGHDRDMALVEEQMRTQHFVDWCHLSPGPLGPFPKDPWEGRAAIPEREVNMVGHRQSSIAKARQQVEQIWLSALANSQPFA